jgi:hypothetical protein
MGTIISSFGRAQESGSKMARDHLLRAAASSAGDHNVQVQAHPSGSCIPQVLIVYPRIKASEFVESGLKFFDLQLGSLQCLDPTEFRNGHIYWRISPSASTLDSAFILANFKLPLPSCSPAQLAEFPGGACML